jgi:predicted alpha/beta superfamily hydrolase
LTYPKIIVIEENYEIPQLKRRRRIAAILPWDYDASNKVYPVLYLHDGQNLFNEHAPYGNWAIDKSLDTLSQQGFGDVIIIAIDHGNGDRIKEYFPYTSPKFGKGQGKKYLKFLMKTLKPYVDANFRVSSDYLSTGIGGSSMGGLISLYAGLTMPTVFGKMLVFSPSIWTSSDIYNEVSNYKPKLGSSLYLYAGAKESKFHLPNINNLTNSFKSLNFDASRFKIEISINKEGNHSEYYWGQEFPKAIKWLYFNSK